MRSAETEACTQQLQSFEDARARGMYIHAINILCAPMDRVRSVPAHQTDRKGRPTRTHMQPATFVVSHYSIKHPRPISHASRTGNGPFCVTHLMHRQSNTHSSRITKESAWVQEIEFVVESLSRGWALDLREDRQLHFYTAIR